MGGYLDYYGIRDWYGSLPLNIRKYLYKSCSYGLGTDSENLLHGNFSYCSHSETQFLCIHAVNAVQDRIHAACDAFMDKALLACNSEEDHGIYEIYSARIASAKESHPDQEEIDRHKSIIYQLIKDNPGIRQSHIKRNFPPHLENMIGLAYWAIYQAGKIRREKNGSSFQVFISDEFKEGL